MSLIESDFLYENEAETKKSPVAFLALCLKFRVQLLNSAIDILGGEGGKGHSCIGISRLCPDELYIKQCYSA